MDWGLKDAFIFLTAFNKLIPQTNLRVFSHLPFLVGLNWTPVHFPPLCGLFGQVWKQQWLLGGTKTTGLSVRLEMSSCMVHFWHECDVRSIWPSWGKHCTFWTKSAPVASFDWGSTDVNQNGGLNWGSDDSRCFLCISGLKTAHHCIMWSNTLIARHCLLVYSNASFCTHIAVWYMARMITTTIQRWQFQVHFALKYFACVKPN